MDAAGFTSRLPVWSEQRGVQDRLGRLVRLAVLCHPDARDAVLQAWKLIASPSAYRAAARAPKKSEGESMLQTPEPLAAHLLRGTLSAANCPTGEYFNGAMVEFTPDGRPRSIEVPRGLSGGCLDALVATARISTADSGDPVRRAHEIVLPMSPDYLACAAEPFETPLVAFDGPLEGVRSPRLIKEVKPNYSRDGMQQKLEGVVELEGVLSGRGCMSSVRVTRSLSILDIKAIEAVLRWKFDPAYFGDRPVPMLITVELTFKLR